MRAVREDCPRPLSSLLWVADPGAELGLHTCGSHICVIILFYGPGIFSVLTQWFGYHIPFHIYILLANVYILIAPTFNPTVHGIKTKQIRDLVVHLLFPKQI